MDKTVKIGIMQPYFLPYLGYFQLINAVDKFIIYDQIKYTKKGWINRNRILLNNKEELISIPLKKDSDYLNINERYLSNDFGTEQIKLLNKIKEAYRKAPFYNEVFPLVEKIITYRDNNLFNFLIHSLKTILEYLEIKTPVLISSLIDNKNEFELEAEKRVIYLCKKAGGNHYINPIGGLALYKSEDFLKEGILLNFIKMDDFSYSQFSDKFISHLSVLDVLMFNGKSSVLLLNKYCLLN